MASGNDAAYTVAVNTSRLVFDRDMTDTEAVQAFCELMNQTAEELGMNHSHFCNPDGWDNPDHYTTVNDLLLLSMAAYANYDIRNIALSSRKSTLCLNPDKISPGKIQIGC